MSENKNQHVYRMARFLPFDPMHDQIYEEYQVEQDSMNLETVALTYVLDSARNGAQIIVLTGDAGHGKTHLCRRVVEKLLGYNENEARKLINKDCDGRQVLRPKAGVESDLALRVFKDFSEFTPEVAAGLVENAAHGGVVTIICANEGRLRAVLSSSAAGKACAEILKSFEATFSSGSASQDGRIHIVNLNYQSIAAGAVGESLADRAIRDWTSGNRWRICSDCDSASICPIVRNRNMLSERTDEVAVTRKQKLRLLLATLERVGYVITIRDMLMAFAYLMTGGLKCDDVHRRRGKKEGWQQSYAFYNLAFKQPPGVSKEQLRQLPLMQQLPKIDPGRRAVRIIDERIVNQQGVFPDGDLDLQYPAPPGAEVEVIDAASGVDEIIGDPRNRKQRAAEAENVTRVVRALRRRAYFDGIDDSGSDMAYLGLPYGTDFLKVAMDDLSPAERSKMKTRMIAGLHHVQGLSFPKQKSSLYLVDPAFGRSMSGTAILASSVPPANMELMPLSAKWGSSDLIPYRISESVDWIDRYVVLRIFDKGAGKSHDLLLDLVTFDCILRAAAGHVPTKFYEHDIRRVEAFLAGVAQSLSTESDEINVIRDGIAKIISIDGSTVHVS